MSQLLDFFRADPRRIRWMLRFDAAVTALAALPMLLAPTAVLRLLDLGAIAPWIVQATGAVWLAYAIWLAVVQARPLGRAAAAFAIFMMVGTALEVLVGPLVFATGTGVLGWACLLAVALFADLMIVVWLAVWRETDAGTRLSVPTGART